MMMMSTLY